MILTVNQDCRLRQVLLTVTKNDANQILVFFGTGDEMNLLPSPTNYFWEIWDDNGTGKLASAKWPIELVNQWVLAPIAVFNYVVYFTTWENTGGGEYCGAGKGWLYGYTITKAGAPGGEAGLVTLDAEGNPNAPVARVELGPGIPSAPVVTNGMIYTSSSVDADSIRGQAIPKVSRTRIRSWREVL